MNCDEIRELLEAYALGALDAETQSPVEQHLAQCPDCRQLAQEYQELVALLPQALAQASKLEPPAALKARLLSGIKTADPPPAVRLPQRPSLRRLVSRYASSLAAALLLLALAWIVRLNVVLAQEQGLRERLLHQTELIFEVVDSDKTTRRFLAPTEDAPRITSMAPPYGKLFTRSDLPYVVAMTGRLPQPPAGKAYHLWLFRDGEAELAGAMTVDEKGFGSFVYDAGVAGPVYNAAQLILQDAAATTPDENSILIWEIQPDE